MGINVIRSVGVIVAVVLTGVVTLRRPAATRVPPQPLPQARVITNRVYPEWTRLANQWTSKMSKELRAAKEGDRAALDRGLALMADSHASAISGMVLAQRLETAGRGKEVYDLSRRMIRKDFDGVGIQDVYAEHYLMAERRGDRDEMAYSIKRAKAVDAEDLFRIAAGAARQTNRQAEKAKWEKRAADAKKPDVR